ncbi:hypothetical protein CYMTET_33466, partial [Cymbomonas tetramitiformis]
RVEVVQGKVEDLILPEKADILISEPMGTCLLNERMIETYLIARDKFLKQPPNGSEHLLLVVDAPVAVGICCCVVMHQWQWASAAARSCRVAVGICCCLAEARVAVGICRCVVDAQVAVGICCSVADARVAVSICCCVVDA